MVVCNVNFSYHEASREVEPPSAENGRLGVQEKRTAPRSSCHESSPPFYPQGVFPFSITNRLACANIRECSTSTLATLPLKTIPFCQYVE